MSDTLLALAAFAFATSITPGPNNLMLMASGANFGVRRTMPHMLGVAIGFVVLAMAVGTGLAGVFQTFPVAHDILTVVSVVYLLWLAWRIARARPAAPGAEARGRPMTFLEAAAFQWVNPKAWAMALTAVTVYAPDQDLISILQVTVIFGAINLPSVGSWCLVGQAMARVLTSPRRARLFNITMAVLLVGSLYPIVT